MRRNIHRVLSGLPILVAAYLALWVSAFPNKARDAYKVTSALLVSDARFFWLCSALIGAYAILWWLTSLAPRSRRAEIQAELRDHQAALAAINRKIRAATTDVEYEQLRIELQAALNSAANWIERNMSAAALEMFQMPASKISFAWSWPGDHNADLIQDRSGVITLNEARLAVLETLMKHDGWDASTPSLWQRISGRVLKWKSEKSSLTTS